MEQLLKLYLKCFIHLLLIQLQLQQPSFFSTIGSFRLSSFKKKIEKNYWQRKLEILFALNLNTRLHLQIAMDRLSVRGGVVGGRRQGASVS